MSGSSGSLEIIVERQHFFDEHCTVKALNFNTVKSELDCNATFLCLIVSAAMKEFLNEMIFEENMSEEEAKVFLKKAIDNYTSKKANG